MPSPAVRNLIREGKTHQIYSVLQTGSALGMQTMDTALAGLVRSGKITQKLAEARSSTPRSCDGCSAARAWRRSDGGPLGANVSTYVFKAIDLTGSKARGEVEAESKQAVADQLKARGLVVLDVSDKHKSKQIELAFMKHVPLPELAVFSRQLATMISSGMSILRALYVLEEQAQNKFLKETIVAIRKDVEAGLALSDSMARHPKVFNQLFVAMVKAGETGGVLESSLVRVADQLEKDASLRKQIRSAMVYPTLVITFALGVLVAMVAFVIPVFVGVFKNFGGELPAITQISVGASKAVTRTGTSIIVGAVVVVVSFMKWKSSSWRAQAVGPLQAARPDEDRLDRPGGRPGALVAHAGFADCRRRAAAAGAGDRRQDLRQRCGRGVHDRCDRFGEARRHAGCADRQGFDLPEDGRPDGQRRRGNRRIGLDARQDRGVLRGPR